MENPVKRITALTLVALLTASAVHANGCGEHAPAPAGPADTASAAGSADLCTVPTSVAPSADAETWPCKNFSK